MPRRQVKPYRRRILPTEIEKAQAEEAAKAENLYEEELKAELDVPRAQNAYEAAKDPDKKAELKLELEIAKSKLAWQKRLPEAAGLPPRHT